MKRKSRGNESKSDGVESFSYIEDCALDKYLLTAKEKTYKTRIWEELNRDYLERQAFKGAGADQKSQNTDKIVKEDSEKNAKRKKVESNKAVDVDKIDPSENSNEDDEYLSDNVGENRTPYGEFEFDFDF